MRTNDRRAAATPATRKQPAASPAKGETPAATKATGWTPAARAAPHDHAGHAHGPEPLFTSRSRVSSSKRPEVVSQDLASLMPTPRQASVSGPRKLERFTFEKGVQGPANEYTVTVGNHSVKVTLPVSTQQGLHNATIEQVTRTLARMPAAALREVKEVRVSPSQNPADSFWAKKYNRPDFRSYMTAGREGIVRFYPQPHAFNEKAAASSILHETGHVWSYTSRQWKAWDAAAKADGTVVSRYGQSSLGEDVSETTAIYLATRGTSQFDAYRAIFPNRFAILDARFGASR